MKKYCLVASLLMSLLSSAWAGGTRYQLTVDGLACPYCAYGIEKKLEASAGVVSNSVVIKLNEGIVEFEANRGAVFTEESLGQLINDAGFTLRKITTVLDNSVPNSEPR